MMHPVCTQSLRQSRGHLLGGNSFEVLRLTNQPKKTNLINLDGGFKDTHATCRQNHHPGIPKNLG